MQVLEENFQKKKKKPTNIFRDFASIKREQNAIKTNRQ